MIEKVKKLFKEKFNNNQPLIYFSPGRVNIIGEHIDYNGGRVLPMAISLGIYGAVSFNNSPFVKVYSDSFHETLEFNHNNFEKDNSFLKYIKGIIYILQKHQYIKEISGFDLLLFSTLPPSSGLSSSAALELLIIKILNDRYQLHLDDLMMIKLAQETERDYVGVNCGIMDQFAIGMGKKDYAIYLDTNEDEFGKYLYKYIHFKITDATFVIINTNKPRNLIDSKYNKRRWECEKGLEIFKTVINKNTLCDYTLEELENNKCIFDDIIYHRLKHVISENGRVKQALIAMETGNIEKLGSLLKQSHQSLKDDYDVTGLHLDTIWKELITCPMVLGARMTGAGFGGCLIALFKGNNHLEINEILNDINKKYLQITGINLDYYYAKSSDKTMRLEEDDYE